MSAVAAVVATLLMLGGFTTLVFALYVDFLSLPDTARTWRTRPLVLAAIAFALMGAGAALLQA